RRAAAPDHQQIEIGKGARIGRIEELRLVTGGEERQAERRRLPVLEVPRFGGNSDARFVKRVPDAASGFERADLHLSFPTLSPARTEQESPSAKRACRFAKPKNLHARASGAAPPRFDILSCSPGRRGGVKAVN